MAKVLFLPDNITVEIEHGSTLLQAAQLVGLPLKATCGGKGTCGKCLVDVITGEQTGRRPACKTIVNSDMTVEIPQEARLEKHKVLLEESNQNVQYDFNPLLKRVSLILPEPSLTENASDLSRLIIEVKKQFGYEDINISLPLLQKLPKVLRDANWQLALDISEIHGVNEIIDVLPADCNSPLLGLAVDIGTTTIVVYVIDLLTGEIIDKAGSYNKQAKYGDDVITRMIFAEEEADGLDSLQKAVWQTVNELVQEISNRRQLNKQGIKMLVCAGNTTMTHLLLGLDPKYLRLEPYLPVAVQFPIVKIKDLNLPFYQEGFVVNLPSVASYVGGDIVSGVLSTGVDEEEALTLFIDIGTNGEMVLGNRDWLISCACSAGPAFEGGGISFGMRAMIGAIEQIEIQDNFNVVYKTIADAKPIGICGSGLIDCVSKLRGAGVIDRTGKFQDDVSSSRIREGNDGPEFVLAWASETDIHKDIVITESDIKNLLRAKGAIYAGIKSMLQMVSLEVDMVDKILIAGGFGNYLNLEDAIQIGLLPDMERKKYSFVGNTSVKGSCTALTSKEAYQKSLEIGKKITYLELSVGNVFMEEFVSATFIPHTDLTLFPSLSKGV